MPLERFAHCTAHTMVKPAALLITRVQHARSDVQPSAASANVTMHATRWPNIRTQMIRIRASVIVILAKSIGGCSHGAEPPLICPKNRKTKSSENPA
eukprot:4733427-Amphidinium_carterae.1